MSPLEENTDEREDRIENSDTQIFMNCPHYVL